jgi:16S rRNA (guanine527-N7)-methyltransferase
LGSGAGFPGLPLKLYHPAARVTLLESQNKKAAFLKEVIRAIKLTDINVFPARAEEYASRIENHSSQIANHKSQIAKSASHQAHSSQIANHKSEIRNELVTLRAVERFEKILSVAARLLARSGTLALLIGAAQIAGAQQLLPDFSWPDPVPIPLSASRVLLVGRRV